MNIKLFQLFSLGCQLGWLIVIIYFLVVMNILGINLLIKFLLIHVQYLTQRDY